MNMTTTNWKSLAIAPIILLLLTLFPTLLDAIETTPRLLEATSTTTSNNDPLLATIDQMVDALSKEEVQRQDSLFEQSVRFDFSTKKGNTDGNSDGPVINMESQDACLKAVTLAKWYHLHHQTENKMKYLELSLQLFNLNFLYYEVTLEFKKTVDTIQDMYNNEMKREEEEKGSGQHQQINNNDNSNINDVTSPVISRNNVNVNVNVIIDWTDPIFLRGGWTNDPIVIESHKLIFFPVNKNAGSQFLELFRRMMGLKELSYNDVHNPQINGLRYLGHYSRHEQQEMISSTEWTRAIFVRDPLQRLVSGYKNKALKGGDQYMQELGQYVKRNYVKERCCGMNPYNPNGILSKKYCAPLRPYNAIITEDIFPFSYFVEQVLLNCPDIHWNRQAKRMHATNWQLINFVGNFDHLKEDAHTLLKKIGAYEEFGAYGWGKDNGAIFEANLAHHATDTQQTWEHYFVHSPQLLQFAVEYYAMDYKHPVLNFTKPELLLTMVATDPGTAVDSEL